MTVLEKLLTIDKSLQVPVYLQIANDVICYIRSGTLKPGSPLPASRMLAKTLGVHRKTVIAAYDELYAQSWINVYPRKGIFVAQHLPEIKPRPIEENTRPASIPAKTHFKVDENFIPFKLQFSASTNGNLAINDGYPDTRIVPIDLLVREYRRLGNYHFTGRHLMYGPEQGSENLRNELAKFFSETRGLHIGPDNILITKGAQMAIYLISQVLLTKNDIVVAGDPGYNGSNEVFEHAGARVELVPVDEFGISLDAVEELCKTKKVKLLYVIPHHHRPTTVTLCSERRMRLLELAAKHKFAIIEDDYDYDFHYTSSPILPLASADYYGSVIYIGSFSKIIAPGIRIGFMAAPGNLIEQVTRLRRLIDRQGEQLMEEAIASLLKNGDIGRHLKKANKLYHERRDIMSGLLQKHLAGHVEFKVPDGGFAIWLKFLNDLKPKQVAATATSMGLSMTSCGDYYADPNYQHPFIRMGFASLNKEELEEAINILTKAVHRLL